MRDEEKLRSKVSVSLDGHQVAYLIFGAFVVATLVFAAGFAVGLKNAPPARPAASAELACLEVLDGAIATSGASDSLPELGFEERVALAEQPAASEDPALRLLADGRDDLALPGTEPPLEPEFDPEPATEPGTALAGDAAAAEPAATPDEPPPKARYTLQVQAFRDRSEADAFAAGLRDRGHSPYVQESRLPGKGRWFRVRVGHFAGHHDAREFKKTFESSEGIDDTFITPLR